MSKIQNFFYGNNYGELNQVHMGIGLPVYPIYDINFEENSYKTLLLRGRQNKILWTINNELKVIESKGELIGYPTVDQTKIVIIYQGDNSEFKAPRNAVVYNFDGEIDRVLEPPAFESKLIQDKLHIANLPNPPLDIEYDGGLFFKGVFWKVIGDRTVMCISIIYDREWFETRVFDSESGRFGECLFSGRI